MKFLSIPETRTCKKCNNKFTAYIKNVILCPKCRRNEKKQKEKEENEKTEFIKNYYNKQEKKIDKNLEDQNIENMIISGYEIFDDDFDISYDIYMPPNRKCHDCGKLINNYRCDDCWEKWKIKNHIPLNNENLDDIDK